MHSLKAPCEAEATQTSTSGPSHVRFGFPSRELEYDASGFGVSRALISLISSSSLTFSSGVPRRIYLYN